MVKVRSGANEDIRSLMKRMGVRHTDLADALGEHSSALSVILRYELAACEKEKIKKAIIETSNRIYGEEI